MPGHDDNSRNCYKQQQQKCSHMSELKAATALLKVLVKTNNRSTIVY